MTIGQTLKEGVDYLKNAAFTDTPVLDAHVLLAHALARSKESLFAGLEEEIGQEDLLLFREYLSQRRGGRPVSYIRGIKEFYGLEFIVDERVMVPRPATEGIIETVCSLAAQDPGKEWDVHDLCTGSGCIAIALKYLFPAWNISASDISGEAAAVFKLNSERILKFVLPFFLSDLFENVGGRYDMITANPPYLSSVKVREMREKNWPEPRLALDGGPDGLEFLKKIIRPAPEYLKEGGILCLEADPPKMPFLRQYMLENGFSGTVTERDLGGAERILRGMKK